MIRKIFLMVALLAISSHAQAETMRWADLPKGAYALDPTHASLVFMVDHLGLSDYTARFNKFTVALQLGETPETSRLSAAIDPTSIDTGNKPFDSELADKKLFDSKQFPAINFTAERISVTGEATGLVAGSLEMMGVRRPVEMEVRFNGGRQHPFKDVFVVGFSANGSVKRSDFGMKQWEGAVGDVVQFAIEAEFVHQPATDAKP